jgi:hypothetical protein
MALGRPPEWRVPEPPGGMTMETGYLVHYCCAACGHEWEATWSCACDDECGECGAVTQAADYELDGTRTQQELDAHNSMRAQLGQPAAPPCYAFSGGAGPPVAAT